MRKNSFFGTALGKFVIVAIIVLAITSLIWEYQANKFSAITKIPPATEYNLADAINKSAYDRLVQAYAELDKLKGQDLSKASIIDPAISRANAFKDLGDTGRAILAYQWLNKYRPAGLQGFSNLANLYVTIGEYEKAEKNYLIAIKNSTIQHIEPYEGLFNLYQGHLQNKFPQIEQVLLDSIAKTTAQNQVVGANFYNLLAQYYEAVGRTGDAIVQYQKILKTDPKNIAIKTKIKELGGK